MSPVTTHKIEIDERYVVVAAEGGNGFEKCVLMIECVYSGRGRQHFRKTNKPGRRSAGECDQTYNKIRCTVKCAPVSE
jgi:hypothetical protein